jgi:hypothetical protein
MNYMLYNIQSKIFQDLPPRNGVNKIFNLIQESCLEINKSIKKKN